MESILFLFLNCLHASLSKFWLHIWKKFNGQSKISSFWFSSYILLLLKEPRLTSKGSMTLLLQKVLAIGTYMKYEFQNLSCFSCIQVNGCATGYSIASTLKLHSYIVCLHDMAIAISKNLSPSSCCVSAILRYNPIINIIQKCWLHNHALRSSVLEVLKLLK